MRIGIGYDLHRFCPGRKLVLGGVEIPHAEGLAGHSDADVLCHALADALLGAANLGDIGGHFPDSDPAFRDACSLLLLEKVVKMVGDAGYRIGNVDAVVIAEFPKLLPFRDRIVASLSRALGLEAARISVKAKTNEGLDATGRQEAIAVFASVLLEEGGRK